MKGNTPVYTIKPKYIFKSPFLKYDLQNPTNRQAQNEELTQYFNYGFNEDTMNIYAKLVNRTLKVLDHKKNLEYFDQPSELMRLNDQIPMDLGGFCKFYDPQVFKNDFIKNDQQLFKIFLFNTFKATYHGKQYPMLQFVKSMYPPKKTDPQNQQNQNQDQDNPLPLMVQQISHNLEKKYEQTMRKLIQQKNQPKQIHPSALPFNKKGGKFEKKPRNVTQQQQKNQRTQKQQAKVKIDIKKRQKQQKRQVSSSSSSSSSGSGSSSSSSDSDSSSSDSQDRHRRHKDRKPRDNKRERSERNKKKRSRSKQRGSKSKDKRSKGKSDRPKKESRRQDRDKTRKIKKKTSHHDRRSRSRDHKKKHR